MNQDVSFAPAQLQRNTMNTLMEVQQNANSKQMSEQGRSEMRSNMIGYSDTLG